MCFAKERDGKTTTKTKTYCPSLHHVNAASEPLVPGKDGVTGATESLGIPDAPPGPSPSEEMQSRKLGA